MLIGKIIGNKIWIINKEKSDSWVRKKEKNQIIKAVIAW